MAQVRDPNLTGKLIVSNMVQFIRQHGKEEVSRINQSCTDAYILQKSEYMED